MLKVWMGCFVLGSVGFHGCNPLFQLFTVLRCRRTPHVEVVLLDGGSCWLFHSEGEWAECKGNQVPSRFCVWLRPRPALG